ncbi:MAG: rod shape-determining protein MreD [Betaproteobacteria bacterium]|nr:rod shape-determining protein MreD [Betaproteobacteria bacterium]
MIMPAGKPLLLPANPRFIVLTLVLALLLNMLLNLTGQAWLPDVLAVVLVFWTVHQPQRVGMFSAFALGLALDVHESTLLGQNALSYVLMGYLALAMHRRLLCFAVREQALQVLPLFLATAVCEWLTRLLVHDLWPSWPQLIAPFLQAALWPLLGALLLAPQRRPVERDDIRPL